MVSHWKELGYDDIIMIVKIFPNTLETTLENLFLLIFSYPPMDRQELFIYFFF